MKNRRSLKQAFVATVAASAATVAMAGCFEGDVINNPPGFGDEASCPDLPPAEGSFCDSDLTCQYEDDTGCPIDFVCDDGRWESWPSSCNPPPPSCPAELPEAGTACVEEPDTWGYPSFCVYDVTAPCGPQQVEANCVSNEVGEVVWEVTVLSGCESPPEACGGYTDSTLCDADPGCQWLVPGCAEGFGAPPATEGCYAAGDCAETGCGTWGVCDTVVHNPCWNDFCDACGSEMNVCVPPDGA